MTSTKFQINYNVRKFNDQNSFGHPSIRICFASYGQVLIIDISNLFVICFLLFGALIQNLSDFMD